MFGLKGIAIALAVGAALGNVTGWRITKAFDDSRWFKAIAAAKDGTIRTLETRIKVANAATVDDQKRAADAETARAQAEERAKNAEARIATTPAFDATDTDRLRDLWRPAARGNPKR